MAPRTAGSGLSRQGFAVRVLGLLIAAGLLALLVRELFGANILRFYGVAGIALLSLPFLWRWCAKRLRTVGRSGFWALLLLVPLAFASLLQIGFWAAFFHGSQNLAGLEIGLRNTLYVLLDPYLQIIVAAAAVPMLWLLWQFFVRADRNRDTQAR
jgi:uncharacterized membrane protein YhaH (DUF805 family)